MLVGAEEGEKNARIIINVKRGSGEKEVSFLRSDNESGALIV